MSTYHRVKKSKTRHLASFPPFARALGTLAVLFGALHPSSALAAGETLWPNLAAPAPGDASGANDAAIIIAIESYAVLPKVKGAVDNGTLWYQYFTGARKVPEANVQILRDGGATMESILPAIAAAAERAKAGGKVWFVFIGHGGPARDAKDGVLVTFDAQQNPDSLYARSISQRTVLDALAKSAAQPVAIIDACFSGLSARYDAEVRPIAEGVMPTIPVELLYQSPAIVLSAGKPNEFAGRLPGAQRPAFSYLALGALRGWADENHDGVVTAAEVVSYARAKLVELPIHREQTPQLTAPDGSVALATGVKEAGPSIPGIVAQLPNDDSHLDNPTRREPANADRPAHTEGTWSTQKSLALVSGGVGVASAVVAGVFAAKAVASNNDSKAECNPADSTQCSAAGVTSRSDARSAAGVATVGTIVAAVGLGAAAVLWFTAPSGDTQVGVGLGGFSLRRTF